MMCHPDLLYSLVFLCTVQRLVLAAAPSVDPWRSYQRSSKGAGAPSDLEIPASPPAAAAAGSDPERGLGRPDRVSPALSHALPHVSNQPFTCAAQCTPVTAQLAHVSPQRLGPTVRSASERPDPPSPCRPPSAADATPVNSRRRRGGKKRVRQRRKRGGRNWRRHGDNPANSLLIGQLNAQSLKPKIADIRTDLSDYQFDVLVLCETWLSPNVPNRLLNIDGYRLYRCDRPNTRGLAKGRGGVAMLIRDSYRVEVLKSPVTGVSNSNLEVLWAKVYIGKSRGVGTLCVCVPRTNQYDSPSSNRLRGSRVSGSAYDS